MKKPKKKPGHALALGAPAKTEAEPEQEVSAFDAYILVFVQHPSDLQRQHIEPLLRKAKDPDELDALVIHVEGYRSDMSGDLEEVRDALRGEMEAAEARGDKLSANPGPKLSTNAKLAIGVGVAAAVGAVIWYFVSKKAKDAQAAINKSASQAGANAASGAIGAIQAAAQQPIADAGSTYGAYQGANAGEDYANGDGFDDAFPDT